MNSKNELNIVLEYLIHENFADSHTGALKILEVMSDDWMNSILSEAGMSPERRAALADEENQKRKQAKLRATGEAAKSISIRRTRDGQRVVEGPNGTFWIGKRQIKPSELA